MDRIQNDRSERRLQYYRKWLDTCTTVSDADYCICFAHCDPALSVFHFTLLMDHYLRFLILWRCNFYDYQCYWQASLFRHQ